MDSYRLFTMQRALTEAGNGLQWSVSIFALQEVIRQVKTHFKTPCNSNSHTSPSTEADVQIILDCLMANMIQSYTPSRLNNKWATPSWDLMVTGAVYAMTAPAYHNFQPDKRRVYFASGTSIPQPSSVKETSDPCYFQEDPALDLGDLSLDDEEFPADLDPGQVVSFVEEAVKALSFY